MTKLTTLLIALSSSVAFAQQPKGAPAPPPPPKDAALKKAPPPAPEKPPAEVADTVAMFKGNWSFDFTLSGTAVGDKPFKGKLAMPCKPTAGGAAVACDGKIAKTPMGPWDAHMVIAYDPFTKQVHFIGVTNAFEVHDHKCGQWNQGMAGKSALTCESYKGGMGPAGEAITEDVMFSFHKDGKELEFTSTTTMKDGKTVVFSGSGKK
jgi:hypothetical protein